MARLPITEQHWLEVAEAAQFQPPKVALHCGVSLRHLQRVFQARFDLTPKEWLDEKRIIKAEQMLAEGHSIKVVTIELGYKQTGHFCRQFKAYTKLKPSQFAALAVAYRSVRSEIANCWGAIILSSLSLLG